MWGVVPVHPPGVLDLIWRLLADICQTVPYELNSKLVQLLKVVGRVRDLQRRLFLAGILNVTASQGTSGEPRKQPVSRIPLWQTGLLSAQSGSRLHTQEQMHQFTSYFK